MKMRAYFLYGPLVLTVLAAPAFADEPGGRQSKATAANGAQVYKQICTACHMANAQGSGAGAVPALARNKNLADVAYPVAVMLKGKGAMPPMSDMLTAAQIAAVTGYVRTNFGNNYPQPVTEADVKRLGRGASK